MTNREYTTKTPGEVPELLEQAEADPGAFSSDQDAAVEAGQQGRARRIAKPRAPVAPADLGGRADTTRPETAAINARKQMTVAEAMALDNQAKLERSVMTEQGWYVPRNSFKEQAERRRNGQPAIVQVI